MAAIHLLLALGLAAFAKALTPLGVVVAFALVYVVLRTSGDLFGTRRYVTRLELGTTFLLWFIAEIFKASIDVARLVLGRRVDARPAVVAIRLQRADDRLATVIGCLLTLTPGTLALDYDPASGVLYVHALDAGSAAEIEEGVRNIEGRLLAWMDAERLPAKGSAS
ncbi:MAG: Na+/H+ antiporter subunit E [Azoarcus sp.]|nr:Na+/H+ antiporter subunit E [Azoarcus sp.]